MLMLPPSLDEWLPEGHLARFVAELVDEVLDLGPILASSTEKRGFPPYDPRLMVRLLIYGYTTGVRSSRAPGAATGHGQDGPGRTRRHETAGQRLQAQGDELPPAERVSPAPRGRIPADATARERMARKPRTKPGRAVFGQVGTPGLAAARA